LGTAIVQPLLSDNYSCNVGIVFSAFGISGDWLQKRYYHCQEDISVFRFPDSILFYGIGGFRSIGVLLYNTNWQLLVWLLVAQ
jgi:hypothetical protein